LAAITTMGELSIQIEHARLARPVAERRRTHALRVDDPLRRPVGDKWPPVRR
jgi:hypothetical protein